MLSIHEKYSLKNLNTFNIDVLAGFYAAPESVEQLQELFVWKDYYKTKRLIIGEGSNMLFTKDFEGLVIHPNLKGIKLVEETEDFVVVKVAAGENWDFFVAWSVKNSLGGIENLSLIPGTVGASPVQNIGAYGVEAKDCILRVEAVDLTTGDRYFFTDDECGFAYRDSIFKNEYRGKYLITYVYFQLSKKTEMKLAYGTIKEELKKFDEVNLRAVRQAIINIREAKLPNPAEMPNAGSFFKNPVIPQQKFEKLIKHFPKIVHYPLKNNHVKLAAGWLIDSCGLKGFVLGKAAVHKNQALVLINRGNACGKDILKLAQYVQKAVFDKFAVYLDFEVNVY